MVSVKSLSVALLSIVSAVNGSPTISHAKREKVYDPAIWTSVEWQGDLIHYKTASFHTEIPQGPVNATVGARAPIEKRANQCGASSFRPSPGGPYSTVAHCWALRDWLLVQSPGNWAVGSWVGAARDVWEIASYGTCIFKAGTGNAFLTLIGDEDMADIVRDSINMYQYNGYVGSRGNMGCWNYLGTASVDWALVHD